MQAMILAAGLGTRLRPWTLEHPKALVPVGGVPMLGRVMSRLTEAGFDRLVVNVHHFGEQIIDYLADNSYGAEVNISDERDELLDTGGAILKAIEVADTAVPLLVHNVDILSDAPLAEIVKVHQSTGNDITLLTSGRESSRKLIFDRAGNLMGWKNCATGETKCRAGYGEQQLAEGVEHAFSGIYVIGERGMESIKKYGHLHDVRKFPIMEYFLTGTEGLKVSEYYMDELHLIDIGKPETLRAANLDLGHKSE